MARFSTKFDTGKQDWETPDSIFKPLEVEFRLDLDVCATAANTKCSRYFDPEVNGLEQSWVDFNCWMNPPFGEQGRWVRKAYEESQKGALVVCLLPARTNTNWFHNYCLKAYQERQAIIRFIKGRPKFKGAKHGLPQPLVIVVFLPRGYWRKATEIAAFDPANHTKLSTTE